MDVWGGGRKGEVGDGRRGVGWDGVGGKEGIVIAITIAISIVITIIAITITITIIIVITGERGQTEGNGWSAYGDKQKGKGEGDKSVNNVIVWEERSGGEGAANCIFLF